MGTVQITEKSLKSVEIFLEKGVRSWGRDSLKKGQIVFMRL